MSYSGIDDTPSCAPAPERYPPFGLLRDAMFSTLIYIRNKFSRNSIAEWGGRYTLLDSNYGHSLTTMRLLDSHLK